MGEDAVRLIKERLDIVDVVGDYVRLHKTGKNFKGLCPFHQEKTPSFIVSPDRQTFHCFGCGEGGDIFSFIMKIEGLDFREALEILARKAGVTLSVPSVSGKSEDKRSLFDIMELSLLFYRTALKEPGGRIALHYLNKRDITPEDASMFELGWAPSSWDSLWSHLKKEKTSLKEALDCGLVIEGTKGVYDRFRGRIIFPIRDVSGKLLAFGGRVTDGDGAKYINSPEGLLYSKRQNLYLLHVAKQEIREKKRAILVEGYMDAIRLHLSGYKETIASLGTALTEDQARLLKRFTDLCFICYDSDTAGQEATVRSMYVLQQCGLDVRVVGLPSGKDPDDLLSHEDGKALFNKSLNRALPLVLFHLSLRQSQLENPQTRRTAVEDLLQGFAQLNPIDIAPYVPRVSAVLGVLPHELQLQLDSLRVARNVSKSNVSEHRDGDAQKEEHNALDETIDPLEAALVYCLWNNPVRRRTVDPDEVFLLIDNEGLKGMIAALFSGQSPEKLEEHWRNLSETLPFRILASGGAFCDSFSEEEECWKAVSEALHRRKSENVFKRIEKRMLQGKATREELEEYSKIAKNLKAR
ncbi:MAG: DNA primase [Aminobacterium sp.]|nr:DNA primase [Aminobacterium sp.]MDD3425958.1 DNA primase [Aminobacterium sp.]MDD3707132.1 DNA primase [Aminobacterium sp.]MDD4228711.1 DNA primase [Aminobacterium sp.]MDD4551726.1 DNA primase [Aminobacterium sp.]